MDYILTQEEMDSLTDRIKSEKEINRRDEALEWCRQQLQIESCGKAYCSSCPISSIGADYINGEYVYKEAGKGNTPTYEISKLICGKNRDYPQ